MTKPKNPGEPSEQQISAACAAVKRHFEKTVKGFPYRGHLHPTEWPAKDRIRMALISAENSNGVLEVPIRVKPDKKAPKNVARLDQITVRFPLDELGRCYLSDSPRCSSITSEVNLRIRHADLTEIPLTAESLVGYREMAEDLSQTLGREIVCKRDKVQLHPGDTLFIVRRSGKGRTFTVQKVVVEAASD